MSIHITMMNAPWMLLLLLLVGACSPDGPPDGPPDVSPADVSPGTAPPTSDEQPEAAPPTAAGSTSTGYDFERPEVSFALPPELQEISGLTVLPDGRLGAVQDEEGLLFVLNPATGAIEARHPFGEPGDYEGVERVGDAIYVLRSDGVLMEVTAWAEVPQVRTHATPLAAKNDTEGLAYDAALGRLLIACKENPGAGLGKREKAIYAFDLAEGTLSPEPAFVIDLKALERRLPGKGAFKPSALAVHPTSGEVYVLSSVRKALAVLDAEGGLRQAWPLPAALFEQPEGLAFGDDGALFIASEGDDGPAMLYRFAAGG